MVRLFAERVPEQQPIVLLRPDAERLKSLNESFYRLLNCLRENPAHGNLMALSMLLEILCAIHACREYAAPLQSASFYPTPLMAALDYINGHFQESITNATISGVAAVSPSYLNRLFRKYLHCTPHAYLLSRRMAYARNCLVRVLPLRKHAIWPDFRTVPPLRQFSNASRGLPLRAFGKAISKETEIDLHSAAKKNAAFRRCRVLLQIFLVIPEFAFPPGSDSLACPGSRFAWQKAPAFLGQRARDAMCMRRAGKSRVRRRIRSCTVSPFIQRRLSGLSRFSRNSWPSWSLAMMRVS